MTAEPAWLYVLHLDTPLSHAKHYVGSTVKLRKRLLAHATGRGARFTQVLAQLHMGWTLGGLYQCERANDRKVLERHIKRQKNSAGFCAICQRGRWQRDIKGTIKVSPELVPFPISSREIYSDAQVELQVDYRSRAISREAGERAGELDEGRGDETPPY